MNYNHTKNCTWCNKKFHSQREDAKFCSSTCRVHFHLNKNKKSVINETLNANVLNVSNITITDKKLKDIYKNKQKALKVFLLAHHNEIEELVYDLNLFSEDEYSTLSIFTERAIKLLTSVKINPNILNEIMPEIKKITLEYEQQF